jgi:hypothetical protein
MITVPKRYEWMSSFFRDLYVRYRYLILGDRILNWEIIDDPESIKLNKYFMSTFNPNYRNIINKLINLNNYEIKFSIKV